jgi:hypothetical protein
VVKALTILVCLQTFYLQTLAQYRTADSLHVDRKKLAIVTGANVVFWAGSYVALNKAWYKDYEKSDFHFFDDYPEWNQADKAGHIWTTYHVSRASAETWKWTGVDQRLSAALGGVSGIIYQSIIEIQDGNSSKWGFSWSDIGANVVGSGAFVLQELVWQQQRIQIKLSYWPCDYAPELYQRRNELFGAGEMERLLKDYNSQTYWVSANIASFFPETRLPDWMNVSVGYGVEGLLGGRSNVWSSGGEVFDYSHIKRERKYYLSPDIDLTRIKTKSKALRTVFFLLSAIKVPAPALELSSSGTFKIRALKF